MTTTPPWTVLPRARLGAALDGLAGRLATPPPEIAAAVVVAPHPDDEVLGCGGTIAELRRRGCRVRVVVLTDGTASQRGLADPGELRARRADEAVAAARVLGVEEVELLGFADGSLGANVDDAALLLGRHLHEVAPSDVFVSWRGDPHPDHAAASAVTARALRSAPGPARVHEYPVWYWHRPPWCPVASVGRRLAARSTVTELAGLRSLIRFREVVDVRPHLAAKWAALGAYASQVDPPAGWPRLDEVSGGRWLAGFFTGTERFATFAPGAGGF